MTRFASPPAEPQWLRKPLSAPAIKLVPFHVYTRDGLRLDVLASDAKAARSHYARRGYANKITAVRPVEVITRAS